MKLAAKWERHSLTRTIVITIVSLIVLDIIMTILYSTLFVCRIVFNQEVPDLDQTQRVIEHRVLFW